MCNNKKKKAIKDQTLQAAEQNYPGVAIDQSDDNAVDPKLVKERTKTLGCNPRNSK